MQTNVAVIRAYFESQNRGDWNALDALLGRNVVFTIVPYGLEVRGALQVLNGSRMQQEQLQDIHTEIVDLFATSDGGVAETVTTYTQSSPWNPAIPGVEPIVSTFRRVTRSGCFVFSLRNGRIMRIVNYHDRLSVVQQLTSPRP